MNALTQGENGVAIQRLTAVWALSECALGGVLHAMKLPFTGVILASVAVVIIALMLRLSHSRPGVILRALLVVLSIKFMLSPHTSPTAYLAVSFQAVLGYVIYVVLGGGLLSTLLFAILALLESALQKILVLTILFGKSLWESIDVWGGWVADQMGSASLGKASYLIIGVYIGIYALAGLLAGLGAYFLVREVAASWEDNQVRLKLTTGHQLSWKVDKKNKKKYRFFFPLAILGLIIATYFLKDSNQHAFVQVGILIVRVTGILFLWYRIVAPVLIRFIRSFFKRKATKLGDEVEATLVLLPYIAWIVRFSWHETKHLNGLRRTRAFIVLALLNILQFQIEA
jgi:hypothetical protein